MLFVLFVSCAAAVGCNTKPKPYLDASAVDAHTIDARACPARTCSGVQEACAHLAEVQCTQQQQCGPIKLQIDWPDVETCKQRRTLACVLELGAPCSGATPATISACADELATSCEAYFTPSTVCYPSGSLPTGEACLFGSQCEGGGCRDGHCGGVCLGREGATCVMSGMPTGCCARGMYCRLGPAPGCHHGDCVPKQTTIGATCGLTSCPHFVECNADVGLYCDRQVNFSLCAAVDVVPIGQPCVANSVDQKCSGGSVCAGDPPTCLAPAADDAVCNPAPCLYPATCDASTNTCVLPATPACSP